ncbi:MAG: class I SAM-dependent methyltransferase [Cyanobacteria bacterium RM1_2_2]|nr:class I SAM-dependent methyltransferase [Cyanobacteria bacterium RM1_2_2]
MAASIAKDLWNPLAYECNHAFVWQYGQDLVQLLNPQAHEQILDLGCGTGQLTSQLAATKAEVLGLDRSPEMIAQAKASYPHLSFIVADARQFRVEPSLDAVFSNAALHWILEPDVVISNIHQALKPGGRFVAELGGKGNVQTIIAALNQALIDLSIPTTFRHPWYFPSISDYTTRLERQGFEVTGAWLFDRSTRLEAGEAGLANWLQMFANSQLGQLTPEQQDQVIGLVETQLRPILYQEDAWMADYRRLRVVAVKL